MRAKQRYYSEYDIFSIDYKKFFIISKRFQYFLNFLVLKRYVAPLLGKCHWCIVRTSPTLMVRIEVKKLEYPVNSICDLEIVPILELSPKLLN